MSICFFVMQYKYSQAAMHLSKTLIPFAQTAAVCARRVNEALQGYYLPLLWTGGADNLTINLVVAVVSHLAELLQLGAVLKMFAAGLKIGVMILIIRFSLQAARQVHPGFGGSKSRRNPDEDAIALLNP